MEDVTPPVLAVDLDLAIQRLRARIRAESGMGTSGWSRSQLLVLDRLVAGPPMTTSDLAAAEYVRPQSMAATLAPLLEAGLVIRRRDPDDGRRVLTLVRLLDRLADTDAPPVMRTKNPLRVAR